MRPNVVGREGWVSRKRSPSSGFTHIGATGRQGRFWVRRKTESKRMRAKLQQVNDQLERRRHSPIPDQGRWLASVLRGHFAYYAVPGNDAPTSFHYQVQAPLVPVAAAPQPATPAHLGADGPHRDSMATHGPPAAPVPGGPFRRHTPKVGAQCGNPARWDLCGGRPEPVGEGPSLPRLMLAGPA
jgi:hypothetical protein